MKESTLPGSLALWAEGFKYSFPILSFLGLLQWEERYNKELTFNANS